MSLPSNYKPSPLSFGSPRTSPFRRPESPASPSPSISTLRPTTPTKVTTPLASPTKPHTPIGSPSKLSSSTTALLSPAIPANSNNPALPLPNENSSSNNNNNNNHLTPNASPVRPPSSSPAPVAVADAISKVPPAQVREMREGFQILDRDDDGQVTRSDVTEMLSSLGLDASPATIATFFPPSSPPTLSLPSFLQTLATLLTPLSPPSELLAAFAAFDDDDSGQVDVQELRDALLHTRPETGERTLSEREVDSVLAGFSGRRAFGSSSKVGTAGKGEVFRYREFVGGLVGSGGESKARETGS